MENENINIVPIKEDLDVVKNEKENIENLIYTIRGKQVMLDSDVARLYNTETRIINQVVKRNINRFPERFCFQLTKSEFENLNNGSVTRKYFPNVFTEQGIAMLSALLKSDLAIEVSIKIMDDFIEVRKFVYKNSNILGRLSTVEYEVLQLNQRFDETFNQMQKNKEIEITQQIFFEGQIYDSYSLIIDIIKSAKEKILIIDNYINDSILKMIYYKIIKISI